MAQLENRQEASPGKGASLASHLIVEYEAISARSQSELHLCKFRGVVLWCPVSHVHTTVVMAWRTLGRLATGPQTADENK